jgi:hypothetical protein
MRSICRVILSGSQFWIPFGGTYLDQNFNVASRINISGWHFSASLFIGPCSCRAIIIFSESQFQIRLEPYIWTRTQFGQTWTRLCYGRFGICQDYPCVGYLGPGSLEICVWSPACSFPSTVTPVSSCHSTYSSHIIAVSSLIPRILLVGCDGLIFAFSINFIINHSSLSSHLYLILDELSYLLKTLLL